MDLITSKLLNRLVHALEGIERRISGPLEQHEDAASKHQQTSENKEGQARRIEVRSELSLPIPIREYYEAEQRDRQSKWRRIKTGLEVLGIVIAVALAIFNLCTLLEIQKQTPAVIQSANAATEALGIGNRAYLAVGTPVLAQTGTEVAIPLENEGRVAAKNLSGTLSYVMLIGVDTRTKTEQRTDFVDSEAIVQPGPSSNYALIVKIPKFAPGTNVSILGALKYDTGFGRDTVLLCIYRRRDGKWLKENCGSGPPHEINLDMPPQNTTQ